MTPPGPKWQREQSLSAAIKRGSDGSFCGSCAILSFLVWLPSFRCGMFTTTASLIGIICPAVAYDSLFGWTPLNRRPLHISDI
eukprot:3165911-Amphidinium_carterae.1